MIPTENADLRTQADGGIRPRATGKPIVAQADQALTLRESHGEPRVDSRDIAVHLDMQHESTIRLLTAHEADFATLGILRFQIGEIRGRGQPERYALLNEDQCYLCCWPTAATLSACVPSS